jgi:hypothetical protein
MVKDKLICAGWLILAVLLCSCSKKVTLQSLIREMADRENLSYFPEKQYRLVQCSSYNRESIVPGREGWFANEDMSHFIRVEMNRGRREFVMFDTSGPGVVVRWWMTFYMAQYGILRVYLDKDTVPSIEGRADEILSGNMLAGPPFAVSVHRGVQIREKGRDLDHNLYLPIPFASQCKITFECDSLVMIRKNFYSPDVFYNIDYRKYEAGTDIETFSMNRLLKIRPLLNKTGEELLGETKPPDQEIGFDQEILPGDSFLVKINRKNSAISHLLLKIAAADTEQALRSTVLKVTFDGNRTIWIPAGEFFGTGYRKLFHHTRMNSSDEKGLLESDWIMPYRNECTLTLINYGRETISVEGKAGLSTYKWKKESMYFGASWHEYYRLPTRDRKGNFFDLNFVDISGKGIYAGDQITVFNTSYQWWGEGDEKIFVDGESFPSSFGTGSEDYYGYGFGRPDPFSHPFISQPVGEGNEGNTVAGGLTVNMRHRSLDAIPFHHSISSNIELWHWDSVFINYALTSYWYVQLPFKINVIPDIAGVRRRVVRSTEDMRMDALQQ